jgi:hypothetical protein
MQSFRDAEQSNPQTSHRTANLPNCFLATEQLSLTFRAGWDRLT